MHESAEGHTRGLAGELLPRWGALWWCGSRWRRAGLGPRHSLGRTTVIQITVREVGACYLPVASQHRLEEAVMSPLRTAVLVALFTLATLSSVVTFVEAYNRGEGLWAWSAAHQFALEGDSSPSRLKGR
jgi:hypothetical protein